MLELELKNFSTHPSDGNSNTAPIHNIINITTEQTTN